MKKLSIFLSLILIVSLLSGCAKNNDNASKKDSNTKAENGTGDINPYVEDYYKDNKTQDFDAEDVVNIALFGVDSREEDVFSGNTDSIMILSINQKTKTIKTFSVMCDTLVPMEYEGTKYCAKINSAYSKSKEHAIATINEVFDLNIQDYITVNYFGTADIIDSIGGIEATITDDELAPKEKDNFNDYVLEICNIKGLNPKEHYVKKTGKQTLNGVQAVAYSRVKNATSVWGTTDDWGRADRQLHIVQEMFNKVAKINTSEYLDLVNEVIPYTQTSLGVTETANVISEVLGDSPKFEQYCIPQQEMTFAFTGPADYGTPVYYDLDYAAKMINSIIYDDVTQADFIKENTIEKNDWYKEISGEDDEIKKPTPN